jgi:hypothetical protein
MADEIKVMDLQEFVDFGYLQEANRQFFHLVGLSLGVKNNKKGKPVGLFVADSRDEPEGIFYHEMPNRAKGDRVFEEFRVRSKFRKRLLDGNNNQAIDKVITQIQVQRFRAKLKK